MRDRIGATLSSLQEGSAGVRVIQATRGSRQIAEFEQASGDLYDAHMDSVRISAWYLPVIEGRACSPQRRPWPSAAGW